MNTLVISLCYSVRLPPFTTIGLCTTSAEMPQQQPAQLMTQNIAEQSSGVAVGAVSVSGPIPH